MAHQQVYSETETEQRIIPQEYRLAFSWKVGTGIIATFLATFILVMVLRSTLPNPALLYQLFANLYLAGTIIFGGGPVVIPLLREYVVAEGWVSPRDFLIGLAIAQSFPGPNFNFAVFLGSLTASNSGLPSISGAMIAFVGIFFPGIVLVHGTMGVWGSLRSKPWVKSRLRGVNAGAVGLIYTAIYRIWQVRYIDEGFQSGSSLGGGPWWVVVTATAYVGGRYYGIVAPIAMKDDDDKDQSLRELSLHDRPSIISQLVDIGSKRHQQRHIKFRYIIRRLQCLRPKGTTLRRTSINAVHENQYVALSYTWNPSEHEDPYHGRYLVEGWEDNRLSPSKVRNCVLDRVLAYMRYADVQLLWIDAHCIRQDPCGVAACTSHTRCMQHRDALQAMDRVYQLSKHPIALLARPLQIQSELDLLKDILSGNLVDGGGNVWLSRGTTVHKARTALRLLRDITRDIWWGRAWTFQENYRGGQDMRLLIRHDSSLERQKLRHGVFGEMPGELCVFSVAFSTAATRLCLALRSAASKLPPDDVCRIDDVLRAAGRYTEMVPRSSAMTAIVVADIEARGLSKPWDRLAILANCCQYPLRLDGEALSKQDHSLSLSVLAMCLLNGEILDNNDDGRGLVASMTTSNFLQRQLFGAFGAPEDDARRLTFNKGCRLTNVQLTADGIATKGHLWKLGRVLDTSMFGQLPWIAKVGGRLKLKQRKRLMKLVICLSDLEYSSLAGRIGEYLATDAGANTEEDFASFTEMYLHRMAAELAAAIGAGQKLRLGSIWDPKGRPSSYRAVFVWSHEDGDEDDPPPAFAFTSARSRDPGSEAHDPNDIDRHVSLEVGLEKAGDSVPHVRVCRWLFGMCFFKGCPLTDVVFPWPRVLQALKP